MNTLQSTLFAWKCSKKHIQRTNRKEYIQQIVKEACDHRQSSS